MDLLGLGMEREDCTQMLFSTASVEMCCPVNNEKGEAESEAVGILCTYDVTICKITTFAPRETTCFQEHPTMDYPSHVHSEA